MISDSNTDRAPQAESAPRQPWTTPALRPLDVSTSELGGGVTIDSEGHS